jgi:hypothetical protein
MGFRDWTTNLGLSETDAVGNSTEAIGFRCCVRQRALQAAQHLQPLKVEIGEFGPQYGLPHAIDIGDARSVIEAGEGAYQMPRLPIYSPRTESVILRFQIAVCFGCERQPRLIAELAASIAAIDLTSDQCTSRAANNGAWNTISVSIDHTAEQSASGSAYDQARCSAATPAIISSVTIMAAPIIASIIAPIIAIAIIVAVTVIGLAMVSVARIGFGRHRGEGAGADQRGQRQFLEQKHQLSPY